MNVMKWTAATAMGKQVTSERKGLLRENWNGTKGSCEEYTIN
jgi:hypothetical protein